MAGDGSESWFQELKDERLESIISERAQGARGSTMTLNGSVRASAQWRKLGIVSSTGSGHHDRLSSRQRVRRGRGDGQVSYPMSAWAMTPKSN